MPGKCDCPRKEARPPRGLQSLELCTPAPRRWLPALRARCPAPRPASVSHSPARTPRCLSSDDNALHPLAGDRSAPPHPRQPRARGQFKPTGRDRRGPFPGGWDAREPRRGTSRLDSCVTRHDSATAAGGQGAERPDSPAPHLRLGLGHAADPLFNPADLGEGPGSLHLLCLVDQVSVHRACSLTG
jgi:hypothetical protein